MKIRLDPAMRVIQAFGGANKLAKAIGRDVSRIHRWSYPKGEGGTGGAIPGGSAMLARILSAAEERQIHLSLEDLVRPGTELGPVESRAFPADQRDAT